MSSMSNNEALSGGDLTRTAARLFMGARGGLEVTRADMQNARCLLGDLLSAVADDLEAWADGDHQYDDSAYRGASGAAERVRGLLGTDKTNE